MKRFRCKECQDFELYEDDEDARDDGWKKKGKAWICPDCQDGDGDDGSYYNDNNDDDDDDDDDFDGFGLGSGPKFGGGSFGGGGGRG